MTVRHRRRSVHAEAIAPWMTLSVILLIWWAGAKTLDWALPDVESPLVSFGARNDPAVPKAKPVDVGPWRTEGCSAQVDGRPTISANTRCWVRTSTIFSGPFAPHPGSRIWTPTISSRAFTMRAAQRAHEAIDILAPSGTDVLAVEDGNSREAVYQQRPADSRSISSIRQKNSSTTTRISTAMRLD